MEKSREEIDCLEHLRWLRDEFSDEVPTKIIGAGGTDRISESEKERLKVRKTWWQGVVADLSSALKKGKISDLDLQTEVKGFLEDYTSKEFQSDQGRLVTAEDIKRANRVISMILGEETLNPAD